MSQRSVLPCNDVANAPARAACHSATSSRTTWQGEGLTVIAIECPSPACCRKSLLFLIRSPEVRGSERQLVELGLGLAARRYHVAVVVTFCDSGRLRNKIENIEGLQVLCFTNRGSGICRRSF